MSNLLFFKMSNLRKTYPKQTRFCTNWNKLKEMNTIANILVWKKNKKQEIVLIINYYRSQIIWYHTLHICFFLVLPDIMHIILKYNLIISLCNACVYFEITDPWFLENDCVGFCFLKSIKFLVNINCLILLKKIKT